MMMLRRWLQRCANAAASSLLLLLTQRSARLVIRLTRRGARSGGGAGPVTDAPPRPTCPEQQGEEEEEEEHSVVYSLRQLARALLLASSAPNGADVGHDGAAGWVVEVRTSGSIQHASGGHIHLAIEFRDRAQPPTGADPDTTSGGLPHQQHCHNDPPPSDQTAAATTATVAAAGAAAAGVAAAGVTAAGAAAAGAAAAAGEPRNGRNSSTSAHPSAALQQQRQQQQQRPDPILNGATGALHPPAPGVFSKLPAAAAGAAAGGAAAKGAGAPKDTGAAAAAAAAAVVAVASSPTAAKAPSAAAAAAAAAAPSAAPALAAPAAAGEAAVLLVPLPPPAPNSAGIPMAATRVVMHQIVLPAEVDTLGICFGGQILSWIDVCAGMSAKALARRPCVTASVDSVHFLRPCRVGTVVIVAAMVNRTFKSSMEVGVRVEAEDMRTGARHHCCTAFLTFVALQPQAVPPGPAGGGTGGVLALARVLPGDDEQREVYEEAELRRSRRLERRERIKGDPLLSAALDKCRLRPITHMDPCFTLPRSIEAEPTSPTPYDSPSTPPLGGPHQPPQGPPAAGGGGAGGAGGAGGGGGRPVPQRVRKLVAPSLTSAYMTECIMPQHANTQHITFGGQVMAWMEQCAYISASRMRGSHILTASMDSVTFARSTRVGDILYLTSQVTAIFGSSMEVMVSVHGEDPNVGTLFHCADAYVTVVTVSDIAGVQAAPDHPPHTTSTPALVPTLSRSSDPSALHDLAGAPGGGGAASAAPSSSSSFRERLSELRAVLPQVTPVCLPFELLPQTPTELLRYEGALARREERLRDRRGLSRNQPSAEDRYKPSLQMNSPGAGAGAGAHGDRAETALKLQQRVSSLGNLNVRA